MRKILLFLLVIVSVQSFGQDSYRGESKIGKFIFYYGQYGVPTNYQYRTVRERLIAFMVDSSLHVPRYNGTPVGLRTGSSTNDGLVAVDTLNHILYFYSGGNWITSGTTYTANLPIRITAAVISADTSFAFNPSLVTNLRLQKIIDSLIANAANIYTINGILAGNRIVTMNDKSLNFINSGESKFRINPLTDDYSFGDADGSEEAAVISMNTTRLNINRGGIPVMLHTYASDSWVIGDPNDNTDGINLKLNGNGTAYLGTNTFGDSTYINIDDPNHWMKFFTRQFERVRLNTSGILFPNGIMPTAGSGGTDSALFRNSSSGQVYLAPASAGMTNPMVDVGDMIRGGSSGTPTRLEPGGEGDVLTMTGGIPSWQPLTGLNAPLIPNESWFKVFTSFSTSTANDGMFYGASGTGVAQTVIGTATAVDPLMTGIKTTTGTTSSGRGHLYAYAGGGYAGISINSSYRYTAGFGTMVGALSDGTDTYRLYAGMADDAGDLTAVVDGAFFRYTHGDSSGKWIYCTWANSVKTEKQSDVTVAANTLYDLVVTVIGGKAYFYINSVLKDSLSTNIPSGTARATSVVASIQKTVGTTSVDWYVEWGGYGRVNFGFNYFFIALILAAMFTYLEKKKGLLVVVFFIIGVSVNSQSYKPYVIRTNTDNTKDTFLVKEFTDSVFNSSLVFVQRTKSYYDQFYNPVYPNSFDGYFLCADNIFRNVSPRSDYSIVTNGFSFAADNGANDSYVITLGTVPLAYTNGMMIVFRANTQNTTGATINVNGLGVKNIVKRVNTTLATGDILASMICQLIYDGTNFVLLNPVTN